MSSSILESYQHLVTHIVPGPNSISYFIPLFLLPIALLIPPSVLSHTQLYCLSLPVISACFLHSCSRGGGFDVISGNVVLWSFILLGLQDPRQSFKRMHVLKAQDFPRRPQEIPVEENGATQTQDKGRPRTEEPQAWDEPYPSPISDRISWVFALIVSIRLMYWKTGDPSHDRTQPPTRLTRLAYFRYASATVISSYLIVDTAAFYNLHDPYFAHPNMAIDTPIPHPARDTPTVLTLLRVLPPRLVRSASIGAHAYGLISLGGSFPTIFVIFLNKLGLIPDVWSPQNWPIFFGPFSAVVNRGLRGLWGTWWHQTVRYLGSMPGRSLSHRLGFSPGSVMDYALRATSAFILSGVIHTGLVPPEPSFATLPTWKIKLHIAAFFWVQIPAFGIEMLMLRVARRTFPNASRIFWVKLVVVGWVCGWLCLTIPVLAVALKELGYWRTYPLPLSLWQGLSGRGWWPWAEF